MTFPLLVRTIRSDAFRWAGAPLTRARSKVVLESFGSAEARVGPDLEWRLLDPLGRRVG